MLNDHHVHLSSILVVFKELELLIPKIKKANEEIVETGVVREDMKIDVKLEKVEES